MDSQRCRRHLVICLTRGEAATNAMSAQAIYSSNQRAVGTWESVVRG